MQQQWIFAFYTGVRFVVATAILASYRIRHPAEMEQDWESRPYVNQLHSVCWSVNQVQLYLLVS
jgi:hypothetical protein